MHGTTNPKELHSEQSSEVVLGIDPLALSVTLRGEEHQFDDKLEMEKFLRRLWERTVTVPA